jgi:hypothetical protein
MVKERPQGWLNFPAELRVALVQWVRDDARFGDISRIRNRAGAGQEFHETLLAAGTKLNRRAGQKACVEALAEWAGKRGSDKEQLWQGLAARLAGAPAAAVASRASPEPAASPSVGDKRGCTPSPPRNAKRVCSLSPRAASPDAPDASPAPDATRGSPQSPPAASPDVPPPRAAKRFCPLSPRAAPDVLPPLLVSVEDACAFAAAAGVAADGGALALLQARLREEEVDGEALLATSEAELSSVLGLTHFVSRRKLALALAHSNSSDAAAPPAEVAAWLAAELGGSLGAAAAAAALREGIDGRVLASLRDEEIPLAFDGDAALHAALALALAPLRGCGCVAALPSRLAPLVHTVVLGDTGAGKSSLLNALLSERRLLPTNGMRACTAAIVELSFNHGPRIAAAAPAEDVQPVQHPLYADGQAYSPYVGVIEYLGAEEWRAEVALLCRLLRSGPDGRLAEPEPDTPAYDAWWRIKSAYGAPPASLAALRADRSLDDVLGGAARLEAASADALHDALAPFVDSAADGATGRQLWPLVKRVRVAGPWAALAGGACLVDAPGVNDDNSCRDGIVKAYLRAADAVWLVSNIRRAVNDRTCKDHLLASFRRRLAASGRYGQLAFVATQTDVLVRSEVAENLRLGDASLEEAAAARNAYTKARLERDFWTGLDDEDECNATSAAASAAAAAASGRREVVVCGPHVDAAAAVVPWPCGELRAAASAPSWRGWAPEVGQRGIVVHEWPRSHLSRLPLCLVQFGPHLAIFAEGSLAAPTAALALPLPRRFEFQFPVFTVSAVEFQKLAGLRPDDGAPRVFADAAATELPALSRFLADSVAAARAAADAAAPDAHAPLGLAAVLRAEAAALTAEAAALGAEAAAADGAPSAAVLSQQGAVARELRLVLDAAEATEARDSACGAALPDFAAAAPRAGALLLACIEEAREAAAAAEEAMAAAKRADAAAKAAPWQCEAIVMPPGYGSAGRKPGFPPDDPQFNANGYFVADALKRLNALLLDMAPGSSRSLEVAPGGMMKFLTVVGHYTGTVMQRLGGSCIVSPVSKRTVQVERLAPPVPRPCDSINGPGYGQLVAPAKCVACGTKRPPPPQVLPPPGKPPLCATPGEQPAWTCLRLLPQRMQSSSAPTLLWRGTRRCGFFNTTARGACRHCQQLRLPCASVPPGPASSAAAAAVTDEAQLLQWSVAELLVRVFACCCCCFSVRSSLTCHAPDAAAPAGCAAPPRRQRRPRRRAQPRGARSGGGPQECFSRIRHRCRSRDARRPHHGLAGTVGRADLAGRAEAAVAVGTAMLRWCLQSCIAAQPPHGRPRRAHGVGLRAVPLAELRQRGGRVMRKAHRIAALHRSTARWPYSFTCRSSRSSGRARLPISVNWQRLPVRQSDALGHDQSDAPSCARHGAAPRGFCAAGAGVRTRWRCCR